MFETMLQRCLREGLVDGEAFAVDASHFVISIDCSGCFLG
jgi:hypothetical protein